MYQQNFNASSAHIYYRSFLMTRMSKQGERRNKSPKKRKNLITSKTGHCPTNPFKKHDNGVEGDHGKIMFVPKVK